MKDCISAKVVADTQFGESRITSLILEYPRFIHSELMTHRMAAKNAASSRALKPTFLKEMAESNANFPYFYAAAEPGQSVMAGHKLLDHTRLVGAANAWSRARDACVKAAEELVAIGVHRAISNRLLEPFTPIRVIFTATEFANLFRLRYHPDAEPHFQELIWKMYNAISESIPRESEFHLPLLYADELATFDEDPHANFPYWHKVAAARCSRVSWRLEESKTDLEKDMAQHDRLVTGSGFGHWSPYEHPAIVDVDYEHVGECCYTGWVSARAYYYRDKERLDGHIDAYNAAIPERPRLWFESSDSAAD